MMANTGGLRKSSGGREGGGGRRGLLFLLVCFPALVGQSLSFLLLLLLRVLPVLDEMAK